LGILWEKFKTIFWYKINNYLDNIAT
jgi:hypothetical protein